MNEAPFVNCDRVTADRRAGVQEGLAALARTVEQLAHPAVELDLEEVTPILEQFDRLRRAGVVFDPLLTVLVEKLRQQAIGGFDDDADFEPHLEDGASTMEADSTGANVRWCAGVDDPNAGCDEGPLGGFAVSA